jgi:hypothetical protein
VREQHTSATRTIIDLARLAVSRFELEAAIDSAVRMGLTSPTALAHRLHGLRGSGKRRLEARSGRSATNSRVKANWVG